MDKKQRYDVFLLVFGGIFAAGCGAAALVSAAKHMKRAQGSVLYREGPFAAALIWCVGMAALVIVGGFYLLV